MELKFISAKHTKGDIDHKKKHFSIPFKIYSNHYNLFGKIRCVAGDEMEIIIRGQWVYLCDIVWNDVLGIQFEHQMSMYIDMSSCIFVI
jgi:hypothetical protein